LLVAPAGYGKTTLARQWLDLVGGAWITVTAASGDIAVFARDLADAIGTMFELDSHRVESALSAGRTPEDQARAVGRVILAQVKDPLDKWIVVDDYQLLMDNSASEELLSTLERSMRFRFVIASRERPSWSTLRRRVYLETVEFSASDLALDDAEVAELLPPDRRTAALRKLARGWPAVIGLAADTNTADMPFTFDALSETLYDFLAEELYEKATPTLQRSLTALAVLPPVTSDELTAVLGSPYAAEGILTTGLAYDNAGRIEIHPLARAFLATKLRDRPDARRLAHTGFDFAYRNGLYDEAFSLIVEFGLDERLEELIVTSYEAIIRTGRVATLAQFRQHAALSGHVREALLDLIAADTALLAGTPERAMSLGRASADRLQNDHPLKARGYLVAGRAALLAHHETEALSLFTTAQLFAASSADIRVCAFGKVLAAVYLEDEHVQDVMCELEALPIIEPADRVQLEIARTYQSFMTQDTLIDKDGLDESTVGSLVTDPSLRSGWAYVRASRLTLEARYRDAVQVLRATLAELDEFGLSFGVPHVEWSLAAAELGLRHFARCDSRLRRVEHHPSYTSDLHMQVNVRALRARLLLSQRRPLDAVESTKDDFPHAPYRAMHGEYLATRALALAVAGDDQAATAALKKALTITKWVDTRVLCDAAIAVLALRSNPTIDDPFQTLLESATRSGVWDGLVCAARAAPDLLSRLVAFPEYRFRLREVLLRSNDIGLAKTVGLANRSSGPQGVLSPREREIIDQVRQGRKTVEIASSLFITPGTVKSHMDHIFDKLGVRTRAEAVARYAEIDNGEAVDSDIS
jgi:DNA-binding CsgD family transcriptional regulator